ncbi:hypothetical protein MKX03_027078 [Papaver bracteatum]|nr:hypothetical protein MKX03_027078 [Papaver bracteatum]
MFFMKPSRTINHYFLTSHHPSSLLKFGRSQLILFSTWYSPPPESHQQNHNPILTTISQAIKDTPSKPLNSSLKKRIPSLAAQHITYLITQNPFSLDPFSLLSFFKWVSTQKGFRHTIASYCAMANLLCTHNILDEAQFLFSFIISRKGKDSVSSLLTAILDNRGPHQNDLVFDVLMNAYIDSGFVSDAIQCFRLVKMNGFRVPYHSCGKLLDKLMKSESPEVAWGFYIEILDAGFQPNIYTFNPSMYSCISSVKREESKNPGKCLMKLLGEV